jgi:predicted nucleotidyltransferase
MKTIEFAKRIYERRKKYFDNLDFYLEKIKERTIQILPDAKIYLFGSVVKGNFHTVLSDIDIAIVSNIIPERAIERARIRLRILEGFELSPFELHLLKPEEWEFYKKFIDKYREI